MSNVQPQAKNNSRGSSQTPLPRGGYSHVEQGWSSDIRFKSYHDPQDEPLAEPLDPYAFDFDYGDTLSKEALKGKAIFKALFIPLTRTGLGSFDIPGGHAPTDLKCKEDILLERKPIYRNSLLQKIPYSTPTLVLMAAESHYIYSGCRLVISEISEF